MMASSAKVFIAAALAATTATSITPSVMGVTLRRVVLSTDNSVLGKDERAASQTVKKASPREALAAWEAQAKEALEYCEKPPKLGLPRVMLKDVPFTVDDTDERRRKLKEAMGAYPARLLKNVLMN